MLFVYLTPALCILLSVRHSTAPVLLLRRQISVWLTYKSPFLSLPFLGQSLLFFWWFSQFPSCISFLWDYPVTCLPSLTPRTALPDGYCYSHLLNKGSWEVFRYRFSSKVTSCNSTPPKKNPNAAEVYGFIGLMTNSVVKLQTVLDATVWEWVLASSA